MSRRKPNLRRISALVTAQTAANLEHLTRMAGFHDTGQAIDALVRKNSTAHDWRHRELGRGR